MADDRRTYERVFLPLEARWMGQSGRHKARVSDISLGGCYIESLGDVTIGEIIRFEIQMPTEKWMPLHGEVAYQHPGMGFGVRFRALSELQRKLVESVIEYGLRNKK
jgi:PilZ domain-containing protein